MHIDEAIRQLQEAKAKGRQHIVFAYWGCELFDMPEGGYWPAVAEAVEDRMDWSQCYDEMFEIQGMALSQDDEWVLADGQTAKEFTGMPDANGPLPKWPGILPTTEAEGGEHGS